MICATPPSVNFCRGLFVHLNSRLPLPLCRGTVRACRPQPRCRRQLALCLPITVNPAWITHYPQPCVDYRQSCRQSLQPHPRTAAARKQAFRFAPHGSSWTASALIMVPLTPPGFWSLCRGIYLMTLTFRPTAQRSWCQHSVCFSRGAVMPPRGWFLPPVLCYTVAAPSGESCSPRCTATVRW